MWLHLVKLPDTVQTTRGISTTSAHNGTGEDSELSDGFHGVSARRHTKSSGGSVLMDLSPHPWHTSRAKCFQLFLASHLQQFYLIPRRRVDVTNRTPRDQE